MKAEIKLSIDKFLGEIRDSEYFPKIEFIVLFGSQLGEYHHNESDVDISVYIREDNLETLSKIRLDLLASLENDFDIQMFQLLPIYIQNEVLKGEFLYTRDENELYRIVYDIIEEYEEFYPYYEDYING